MRLRGAVASIGRLEGRRSEFVVRPDGELLSPYVLINALEDLPGVCRFQVVQSSAALVEARVVLDGPSRRSAADVGPAVVAALRGVLPGTECRVRFVDDIRPVAGRRKDPLVASHPPRRPFFAGVAWNSRTSAAVFALAAAGCALAGFAHPALARTLGDANFLCNLFPLLLALGGLYLRLDLVSRLWSLAAAAVLTLGWDAAAGPFTAAGMPALCLPFQLFLGAILLAFAWYGRLCGRPYCIPLGTAGTSPENVRLWVAKSDITRRCWARLRGRRVPTSCPPGRFFPRRPLYAFFGRTQGGA